MIIYRWLLALAVVVLLAVGGLSAWQIAQYRQANAAFAERVAGLESEKVELSGQTAELEAKNAALVKQAESDYYRGILSACAGIGVRQGADAYTIAVRCQAFVLTAYEGDWYHELTLDNWRWPPDEGDAAPPKKSAD